MKKKRIADRKIPPPNHDISAKLVVKQKISSFFKNCTEIEKGICNFLLF